MNPLHKTLTSTRFQRIVNQKKLSTFMGKISDKTMPRWILRYVIRKFIRTNMINMDEYDIDLGNVKSFNEFFIRKLKPGMRRFEGSISSPSDGFISAFGKVENNTIYQVKGSNYSLQTLVGKLKAFEAKSFATIYLSPADYHRVHIPYDAQITEIHKIPGTLFSVNKNTIESIDDIYCKNERVVVQGVSDFGNFFLILVGAIVVGKIVLSIVPSNLNFNQIYPVDIPMKKGQELGYFELGSTVILVMDTEVLGNLKYREFDKIYLGNSLC